MLSGVVLAGGRSSRMGTPKALLRFEDEPLILHIVRTVRPLVDDVLVVTAPGEPFPLLPARVVEDDVPHQGPVGGICYGLQAAAGEFSFITSCDSPFLAPPLISYLLSLRDDFDAVVPKWDDRLQPLVAVYRRTVVPILQAQLAAHELRAVDLFRKIRTRIVDAADVARFDPDGDSFFTMNRPEDYEEALKRWREPRRID